MYLPFEKIEDHGDGHFTFHVKLPEPGVPDANGDALSAEAIEDLKQQLLDEDTPVSIEAADIPSEIERLRAENDRVKANYARALVHVDEVMGMYRGTMPRVLRERMDHLQAQLRGLL